MSKFHLLVETSIGIWIVKWQRGIEIIAAFKMTVFYNDVDDAFNPSDKYTSIIRRFSISVTRNGNIDPRVIFIRYNINEITYLHLGEQYFVVMSSIDPLAVSVYHDAQIGK